MTEWVSGNNENIAAYNYGDKPDGHIDYPDNTMYSITSVLNNHFSVDFKSVRPSYYTTNWQAGNVVWTLYASPDSGVLDPLDFLSAQKSSILQGQSLGALKLLSFQFENVQGFDYQGYLSYTCNPSLLKRNVWPMLFHIQKKSRLFKLQDKTMERAPYKNSKPPYLLGLLCFIPLVGAFVGLGLLVKPT